MAASNVAIANLALQKLGASRIESLTEDHPNARSMNAVFELVRDAELRRYTWNFAKRRASLAADASDTAWGNWNRYSLPNDFLCLIRDDESGYAPDWRIESGAEGEGAFIVTADAAPLDFPYIARITDPNQLDPLFIDAFACKLALQTCQEITQSVTKKADVKDEYDTAIAEARRVNAIEKPAQEFPEDEWLTARL